MGMSEKNAFKVKLPYIDKVFTIQKHTVGNVRTCAHDDVKESKGMKLMWSKNVSL